MALQGVEMVVFLVTPLCIHPNHHNIVSHRHNACFNLNHPATPRFLILRSHMSSYTYQQRHISSDYSPSSKGLRAACSVDCISKEGIKLRRRPRCNAQRDNETPTIFVRPLIGRSTIPPCGERGLNEDNPFAFAMNASLMPCLNGNLTALMLQSNKIAQTERSRL